MSFGLEQCFIDGCESFWVTNIIVTDRFRRVSKNFIWHFFFIYLTCKFFFNFLNKSGVKESFSLSRKEFPLGFQFYALKIFEFFMTVKNSLCNAKLQNKKSSKTFQSNHICLKNVPHLVHFIHENLNNQLFYVWLQNCMQLFESTMLQKYNSKRKETKQNSHF